MNEITPELRRRMEEACALPPDHPCRLAVCEAVCEAGEEAEQLWLDLLREDEQMRLTLRRVDCPPGLHERCRAICDEVDPQDGILARLARATPLRTGLGMAAAFALVLAVWVTVQALDPAVNPVEAATQNLVRVTTETHRNPPDLQVHSNNRLDVEQALADASFPYPVSLPNLGKEYELIGGAALTLDHKPVIYTRWRGGDREYSLYQYCPILFEMDRAIPYQRFLESAAAANGSPVDVMTWSANHCAYALVGEDPHRVAQRSPEAMTREPARGESAI